MPTKDHWEKVYRDRPATSVSWFQAHAYRSRELIGSTGVDASVPIIDVGGGASNLVGDLLDAGYRDLSVLDLSSAALAKARSRLGERADEVSWIEADVTQPVVAEREYAIWHDRAVFHFLTSDDDRQAYLANVRQLVRRGGHVIVATFAADGPKECSGLPVMRYRAEELDRVFGPDFTLVSYSEEKHRTPAGIVQPFTWCHWHLHEDA